MHVLVAALGFVLMASAQANPCGARSGPHTAALVELYTARACGSCPPAERWLAALSSRLSAGTVLPFALHVDYGDYTREKRDVSARQRKLTDLQRMALVYTPHVVLQGREFQDWNSASFDQAVARIHARPAQAHLALEIRALARESVEVSVAAELYDPAVKADAALYLAAVDTGGARRLILQWLGPFAFSEPRLRLERVLPVLPKADPIDSGVAAFVQDRGTSEVLQALMLPACPETFGYIRAKQAPVPSAR
jgi:hypothetical protein